MHPLQYVMYACGQIGMMTLARFFFQWNLEYARQPVGSGFLLAPALFGLVLFGFRLFDGVTDPVAGVISDRWVRRGRRRRELLLLALVIPVVGLALMFLPDASMSEGLRWAVVVAGMFIFFVGYTIYGIPYWSLVADYAGDDGDVRRRLSNGLGAGMLVATAIIAIGSGAVIARVGYFQATLWFGIPATFLMVLPFFAQPRHLPTVTPSGPEPRLRDMVATAFGHRRFLATLVIFSGSQMSFTVMTAGAAAISIELLGGTKEDVPLLLGPFLLTALPFFVLVPAISRRTGWERAVVVASLALGVAYGGTGLLGESVLGGPFVMAGVLFGLAGPMAAVLLGVEGEAITTCSREAGGDLTAIYFGVLNLVVKAMNGLAVFLAGVVLQTGHFRLIGPLAGALLGVGVLGYFLLRPRSVAVQPPA